MRVGRYGSSSCRHRSLPGAESEIHCPPMKILYGVVGEGMGHAMRSRVVLEHLVAQGHDVEIMASGRAVDFLAKRFAGVNRIHGLHMIYEENRVRRGKTLWSNVARRAPSASRRTSPPTSSSSTAFEPEVVISDFESWTYLYAQDAPAADPLDRQHADHQPLTTLPEEIIAGHQAEFQLTKAFVKRQAAVLRPLLHHDVLPPADPQGAHAPLPADPAPGDPRARSRAQRRAPARLQDRRGQRGLRGDAREDRPRVPDLRHAPRHHRGAGRGQPALPPVQRGQVHRRPRVVHARSSRAAASR